MSNTKRIILVIAIIAAVSALMLTVDYYRSQGKLFTESTNKGPHFYKGSVPVYSKGAVIGRFTEKEAGSLTMTSFTDSAESLKQEGWFLKDVILRYMKDTAALEKITVRVASTKRQKYSFIAWKEIDNTANKILLVPSRKGSLKLASPMKGLDTRETWIQDIDRIDILEQ